MQHEPSYLGHINDSQGSGSKSSHKSSNQLVGGLHDKHVDSSFLNFYMTT